MKDTFEFNVQFIELIKNSPCLYDQNRKDYCVRDIQDTAWNKISQIMNEPVNECRDRWKNIRGRYFKYIKQKCEPGAKACKEYYLAEFLQFLNQFYKPRQPKNSEEGPSILDNLEDNQQSSESEDTTHDLTETIMNLSPTTFCNIKIETQDGKFHQSQSSDFYQNIAGVHKERTNENQDVNDEINVPFLKKRKRFERKIVEDPDLFFLKSILPDMRSMTPEQKRNFKIGVITLTGQVLGSTK